MMFADRTLARPHAARPDDAHPARSTGGAAVPAVIWQQPNRAPAGNVRVLHVTAEVYPQVKTGGLGDIAAALPTALLAQGVDARLLVPGYPAIIDNLEEVGLVADLGSLMGAARVRVLHGRLKESGLTAYVVDAPWYFRREGSPYLGPDHRDWSDNIRRFALLGWVGAHLAWGDIDAWWQADILHAHDWHAGLAPVYLSLNPVRRVKSVFSIHNLIYQGLFPLEEAPGLDLPPHILRPGGDPQPGILRAGQLHEGWAGVFRLAEHGQSALCLRDHHAGGRRRHAGGAAGAA